MGFNIVESQDAITARVKDVLGPEYAGRVFEDMAPDDEHLPMSADGSKLLPYVVMRYGPIRPGYTGKSMAGPRYDDYWASCDAIAVAPNGRSSRILNSVLVDALMGFRPDGITPLQMRTDAGDPAQFTVSSNESRPTQYVTSTRLRYAVNGKNVGARMDGISAP